MLVAELTLEAESQPQQAGDGPAQPPKQKVSTLPSTYGSLGYGGSSRLAISAILTEPHVRRWDNSDFHLDSI